MDWLERAVEEQRAYIEHILSAPFGFMAKVCVSYWDEREKLDMCLRHYLDKNPDHRCSVLYAINPEGLQLSSNITDQFLDDTRVGQDLSNRPYLITAKEKNEDVFILSDVYIDKVSRKPCITALQTVKKDAKIVGYIAADFDLKNLPLKNIEQYDSQAWRQIQGDPSIRNNLFQQSRIQSPMDEHLDEVLDVVESLITEQGIFHAKLHFSSSRATLWPLDDPYHYRLHVLDEIINPKVCLIYGKTPYPKEAVVAPSTVYEVLAVFKKLRQADDNIYLRSASLNIMNGMVGLNFSCDGSHYMPVKEFLFKDTEFWLGDSVKACVA